MSSQAQPTARTLTVAVLAGGRSSEHDVSLSSGATVREGLLAIGHEVVWVEIGHDGVWRLGEERLSVTPGEGLLGVDVVFPALHGPFGEDGTVQGLLESLGVAYVGAGVTASAVCADKVLFKQLMSANGLPQVRYAGLREERWKQSRGQVLSDLAPLGLPVFVKPAHLGSSLGIAKVQTPELMPGALDAAFAHDPLVIVEAMAPGVEVECGILGRPDSEAAGEDESILVSEPGDISFSGDWYDFRAKYSPGGMQLTVPARISHVAAEKVKALALETFLVTGCEGLARADFFVDGPAVVVNELNTMPGFTRTSVYARLMAATGIDYPELADRLCRLALERREQRRRFRH